MRVGKEIKIQIHSSNNKYVSDVLTRFHAKFVENRIKELAFPNSTKVEILEKVIETLKSSNTID